MAVYVDPLFRTARGPKWPYPSACHMYADTLKELHAMAKRIGLRRDWFQNKPRRPHYDLTSNKRGLAVRAGAIEHTREECVAWWREQR